MKVLLSGLAAALLLVAGCATTEETNTAIRTRWIGQPSDVFFAQYGPPQRSYKLADGSAVYNWRGGEKSIQHAAQYRDVPRDKDPKKTDRVMVAPARTVELFCELQINVDAGGRISAIQTQRESSGAGFSFSRCAEVFEGR
ncbi:hypothetical protein PIGHUM_00198 [Pigmentiphaga humi]|uniref:Lipoprotein n=1 Tax=Pigmentiphaga humi TaxID=2478468 RepID=A0A3P4AXK0_9BURK|nr:hypothetical protein [Pigmentiphaga humi]VCU68148.1 hypothetical protein PIGHUM_00198 [Pigmentiphaga humi]